MDDDYELRAVILRDPLSRAPQGRIRAHGDRLGLRLELALPRRSSAAAYRRLNVHEVLAAAPGAGRRHAGAAGPAWPGGRVVLVTRYNRPTSARAGWTGRNPSTWAQHLTVAGLPVDVVAAPT